MTQGTSLDEFENEEEDDSFSSPEAFMGLILKAILYAAIAIATGITALVHFLF